MKKRLVLLITLVVSLFIYSGRVEAGKEDIYRFAVDTPEESMSDVLLSAMCGDGYSTCTYICKRDVDVSEYTGDVTAAANCSSGVNVFYVGGFSRENQLSDLKRKLQSTDCNFDGKTDNCYKYVVEKYCSTHDHLEVCKDLKDESGKSYDDECFAERCKEALDLAHQISSVLAFIMKGNPRHCKRFLNTLFMRLSMAKSRHVNLNRKVLAKLMMVELYKSSFYDLLEDKNNKEDLKHLEDGKYESIQGEISKWISDTWIQEWAQNSPKLYQVDLAPYYYFSREKRRYKSSSMANLRPEVRKALEGLLSGTSKGLNDVLKISNDMLPVEREEIANVLFEEMNKDEKLDKKILKAYVEFMIASNLTLEAKNCLMSIPASKFETGNIGTISQLFDKLENKDRGELADYLKTNQTIASQVVTTIKLLNK